MQASIRPLRFAFLGMAASLALSAVPADAAPVRQAVRTVQGVSVRVVEVDLQDPATRVTMGLAHNAPRANSAQETFGDEPFGTLVGRAKAAAVINGTFFSKDAQKRVMGNMVARGTLLKYSQWEDAGTTFSLKAGNVPEMITARAEGKPDWQSAWFSVTCGPRLLKNGAVWLHPTEEGFTDSHVLGVANRSALGYSRDGARLMLVSFMTPVSLQKEAQVMKALGCHEAMNLDGGASQGLAVDGRVLVSPSRPLTNVIAVYDQFHPAPKALEAVWSGFTRVGTASAPGQTRLGDRFVERLKAGGKFSYGKLQLEHVAADPVVGIQGGALTFSGQSYGQVFAPVPEARENYVVEYEARLVNEYFTVFFDAEKYGTTLRGLGLEYRSAMPAGLYLRRNGSLLSYNKAVPIDNAYHRFKVVFQGNSCQVYMDDGAEPLFVAPRWGGQGLGFAGRGVYKSVTVRRP